MKHKIPPMRQIMDIINESIIVEFDINKTSSNYGDKIVAAANDDYSFPHQALSDRQATLDAFFAKIKQIDPTPHQEYSRWLTANYANGRFEFLDSSKMHTALARYHELKKADRLDSAQRDVNRIKGLDALENIVDAYADNISMKLPDGASLVFNGKNFKLVSMKTVEAVQAMAKISNRNDLCTNHVSNATSYFNSGWMYMLFPKRPRYVDEMFQLHFSKDGGFCEATNGLNETITLDKLVELFPELVGCPAFETHSFFNNKKLMPSPRE